MALAGKSRSSRAKSPFVKTTPAFNPMPTPPIVSGSPFTDYAPLARGLLSTLGKQSLQLSEVCLCLRALGWPSTEPRASLWQHAALAAEAAAEAVAASVRMNSSLHIDAAASAAVAASSALVRSPAGGAPPSVGAAGLQALLFVAATCTPPTRITMRDAFLFLAMEEESDESRMVRTARLRQHFRVHMCSVVTFILHDKTLPRPNAGRRSCARAHAWSCRLCGAAGGSSSFRCIW